MNVRSIDRGSVQILCPHRDPILQFFAVEKQWFATEDHKLLGVVIYHRPNNDWAYVVFGPDQRGCYRWIAGESNLASQAEATARLHLDMEQIAETGQDVFRRPVGRLLQSIRTVANRRRARRAARRAARNALAARVHWPVAP
jgi:hypothetical protein